MSDPPNPYESLEPAAPPPGPSRKRRTGVVRTFARGATRRCPRCGARGLFVHWLRIREKCPECGLRLEREEGGFLGAMTINYLITILLWVALLVVWLVLDLPDVHVAALTIVSLALVGLFPIAFWPFSKTLWASVDYLIYRTDPNYPSAEAADRASGNGGRS